MGLVMNGSAHGSTTGSPGGGFDIIGPATEPLPQTVEPLFTRIADHAERTDTEGVPRRFLEELAVEGLMAERLLAGPYQRECAERLAMADASTWFCWVQHISPYRGLVEAGPSEPKERWLSGLASGAQIGAVAFAHVRRPGPTNPAVVRVSGGLHVTGTLDWVTSWDIADCVMVMVRSDDELITFYLPAGHSRDALPGGMTVDPPLQLLALSGTHTRPVRFTETFIPDAWVTRIESFKDWSAIDAVKTAETNPAAFGLIRGAVAELMQVASARSDDSLMQLAHTFASRTRSLREAAYELDGVRRSRDEKLALRAQSLDLAARSAQAVIVARAGAGMRSGFSAERRVREAMFLLVQAQTADTRAAQIELATRQL